MQNIDNVLAGADALGSIAQEERDGTAQGAWDGARQRLSAMAADIPALAFLEQARSASAHAA